ncbi:undecaprenyl-diphosphatase [Cryobacterium sp. CAN_C3]|uniref:undecaprenyl-diphosphate phosphatase n=1 Tax=unclassified Cryobacterium TaxID=2649013 RepID=UPI0018CA758D|nr:undecaprenyl-diphosphate phosphatase [Cryobacterium sp. CAN_C3]MEC5155614.1 undecaprenyl-diphosphatase [Cryobacterium sp. CAN_C3]
MTFLQALILGIVEGITEFLPVSSTGHLTFIEKLLGLRIDDAGVTAFTAIIQLGAIAAVLVYFQRDIRRLAVAWFHGLGNRQARDQDYRLAWYVIFGSIPIGIVGFLAKDVISGGLRNLWVVAIALIAWSAVMYISERAATLRRDEQQLRLRDAIVIGVVQCVALIPGVSRSGATISAGLWQGLNRVAATRISFFLSIPALVAAGAYEGITQAGAVSYSVGWAPTLVATVVSFIVAYASIAWLLRIVAKHPITVFIGYRIALGSLIMVLLILGVVSAT